MLLELVDLLRCVETHEETWLVATVDAWRDRRMERGVLGCPVCRRVYPVVDGVADFRDGRGAAAEGPVDGGFDRAGATAEPAAGATADVAAMRLAAQLDLRDEGGVVVLAGEYTPHAESLGALADVRTLLVNPAAGAMGDAVLLVDRRLPLAAGVFRGAATDAATARGNLLDGFVRALRPGGRLVAPVGVPLPQGVRELARDAREWVGERLATASLPVPLVRRAGAGPAVRDR